MMSVADKFSSTRCLRTSVRPFLARVPRVRLQQCHSPSNQNSLHIRARGSDKDGVAPSSVESVEGLKQSQVAPEPAQQTAGNGTALAGGAVALGVAAFFALRLTGAEPSLAALESRAVPLEQALVNGKPTVVEFYASWCEVCRELVPTEYAVEQQYSKDVNFVMLNIDNAKWAPEVEEYGVRGIPYFVFLDAKGHAQAAAVGRVPQPVLEGNVAALAAGVDLPYARVQERSSSLTPPPGIKAGARQTAPRDHA